MSIRSFFALPLSVIVEQRLHQFTGQLRDDLHHSINPEAAFRWVPPANYHLTLAFLGDIRQRDIQLLHQIAMELAAETAPGCFTLETCEWFPSSLKPRLLVAVPDKYQPLYDLQKRLGQQLNRQGFHIEKRAFRPHISLARVRDIAAPPNLAEERLGLSCEMDELVLFSSTQSRQGPVYTPVFAEPLSG